MVLNPFSLLLVRSRAARGHLYECWDEADLPLRDLQSSMHPNFPHVLSKGSCSAALECLAPEILLPAGELSRSALASKRHDVHQSIKEMLQLSWQPVGLQLQHSSCWRAWPGCSDGEWLWRGIQDYWKVPDHIPGAEWDSSVQRLLLASFLHDFSVGGKHFCELSIFRQIQRHLN